MGKYILRTFKDPTNYEMRECVNRFDRVVLSIKIFSGFNYF